MGFWNYRVKRKRRRWGFSTAYHGSDHHKHYGGEHRIRKKICLVLGSLMMVMALLVGIGAGGFYYLRNSGRISLMDAASSSRASAGTVTDTAGTVSRNGKRYRYDEDIINILCMGIDKTTEEAEKRANTAGESGQADAIVLLTLNPSAHTMKLIAISRDTMTEIDTYDRQGNYVGKAKNHLALAYAFGDGAKKSGEMTVDAVSHLMYDLPIHGYVAVKLDAIEKLNDAVGGVTVTLPEDIKLAGELHTKGETLRLTGEQAFNFVKYRDYKNAGTNTLRMERQKIYVLSFVQEAKKALIRNPMLAAELYQNLTEDMITSIGLDEAVYLASLLPQMTFSENDIQTPKGEIKQSGIYEEFYVDDDALLELIFDTFYTEVTD